MIEALFWVWLIGALFVPALARSRGQPVMLWLFVSLVISPVLAAALLLTRPDLADVEAREALEERRHQELVRALRGRRE